jgi:hypothetical protein
MPEGGNLCAPERDNQKVTGPFGERRDLFLFFITKLMINLNEQQKFN